MTDSIFWFVCSLLTGLGLCAGGLYFYRFNKKSESRTANFARTHAEIISKELTTCHRGGSETDSAWRIHFRYEHQGKTFDVARVYSMHAPIGTRLPILVEPVSPDHFELQRGHPDRITLSLLATGFVFLFICLALYNSAAHDWAICRLDTNGVEATGVITFVGLDNNATINQKNPWMVKARFVDRYGNQQEVRTERLQEIWTDPALQNRFVGSPISIKYNPNYPEVAKIML